MDIKFHDLTDVCRVYLGWVKRATSRNGVFFFLCVLVKYRHGFKMNMNHNINGRSRGNLGQVDFGESYANKDVIG